MTLSKRLFAVCTALFLCCGAIGCTQPAPDPRSTELDLSAGGPGDANTPKPVPDIEETTYDTAPIKLDPALIYQQNESITDGDLVFSDPKCYRTVELPKNISADKINYHSGDLADETSGLAAGKEYLFVDVDIANLSSSKVVCNIGSLTCIFAGSDLLELGDSGEIRYFSAGEDMTSKSFYNLSLEPNESKTITLGYVFDKAELGSNSLYFAVSVGGGAAPAVENSSAAIDDDRKCFALQL